MLARFSDMFADKMKVIWYNWVALLILEFAYVVSDDGSAGLA